MVSGGRVEFLSKIFDPGSSSGFSVHVLTKFKRPKLRLLCGWVGAGNDDPADDNGLSALLLDTLGRNEDDSCRVCRCASRLHSRQNALSLFRPTSSFEQFSPASSKPSTSLPLTTWAAWYENAGKASNGSSYSLRRCISPANMFSILEKQAPAKQNADSTIATLSGRLQSATLLEDRRAAILGLRSFAKMWPASVASGGLRNLISCLNKDVDDVDTTKVILETLLMLFSPDESSVGGAVQSHDSRSLTDSSLRLQMISHFGSQMSSPK